MKTLISAALIMFISMTSSAGETAEAEAVTIHQKSAIEQCTADIKDQGELKIDVDYVIDEEGVFVTYISSSCPVIHEEVIEMMENTEYLGTYADQPEFHSMTLSFHF